MLQAGKPFIFVDFPDLALCITWITSGNISINTFWIIYAWKIFEKRYMVVNLDTKQRSGVRLRTRLLNLEIISSKPDLIIRAYFKSSFENE